MSVKFKSLAKFLSPLLLLSALFAGSISPASADEAPTIRLVGIDSSNAFDRSEMDGNGWVANGWYHAGLRVFTKHLEVGSTNTLTYAVTGAAAGTTVKLHLNKGWSGSTAKVSVGDISVDGVPVSDCGWGWDRCNDAAVVTGTVGANGTVSFVLKNNDVAADAANAPTSANGNYSGKHLFSQITADIGNDAADVKDIVDFVFYKPASENPGPFTGNAVVRLAGIDATNSVERAGDEKTWSVDNNWYRGGVRAITKQVPVGSTQHLTFVVNNAENGAALANTPVTFVFGKQYSGSTAKVNVGAVSSTGGEASISAVTGADGTVSFDLVNTDVAASAADFPTNVASMPTGNDLRTQIAAWVTSQAQDSIDVIDLVYFKPAGNTGGGTTPTPFTGNATVRLAGIDPTNSFERAGDEKTWSVDNNWYRGGVRAITKQVPVGSTQHLTYVVSNSLNGLPLANTQVTLVFGKQYSGSTAKVNVGSVSSTGGESSVTGVTGADGTVSFDLVNTDVAADAADNPGTNLGSDYTGKHLFSQVAAWVTNQGQDSIDVVDMVYFKPADAPVVKTVVARMNGLDSASAFEGSCTVGDWCKYYAEGLRYFEKGLTVGSTTNFSYSVSDTNGAPYANKNVYLLLGKGYSGSTAKVTVNGTSANGSECWCGNDQAKITLTTNAQGQVSFSLTNNDVAADADPYQAGNLAHPNGGKHLFTQMTLVGEKGNADVIDIVDLNFYKAQDAVPATVYNVRLADWNASNSFDGTHVWGDAGISQGWFDANTGYFAHYVAAGSTFNLRYRVTTVAGANAANGTQVTVHLGTAWSGSNASFTSGTNTVNGVTQWGAGGQLDQASFTATVQNGYVTIPLTNTDLAVDATPNPGVATANPDGSNPLFMQVKVTVDGNSVTHQDWVNLVVTKPAAAPTITSVSATSAKKGQAVDIVGTNLGDALGTSVVLYTAATTKAVAINTPVTVLAINAAGTRMTIASPASTQKGYLKVTTGGGTATASALLSSSTTVTSKPAITLTSSVVKEAGATITLSGTNIASSSRIAIGSVTAPFTIETADKVVVTVPAGVVSGSAISATNLGGTTTTSKFVYQAAVVATRTAAARVGQTVTITGKNLVASSVIFGGNKSAKPVINNGSTLTVVVPTGALTGALKITTGAGVVYTESFTVTPPAPTVTSFTPASGKKGVAIVTVKGTNLSGATVTVGNTAVTLSAGATSTSFKFVIPAGATTGKINITTAGGTVSSTTNLTVTSN